MVDVLRTGLSGLRAFQRALATTSHNIANANTPGYSRQRVSLANNLPFASGGAGQPVYIGTGVGVQSISRVHDDFLTQQVRHHGSNVGQSETMSTWIDQLEGVLGDGDTGLSPALNQFFAAVQDAANSPASLSARQALLGRAEALAARFRETDGQMNALRQGVNQGLSGTVNEINTLAENIAKVNDAVALAQGNGGPSPDLLDRRDQLVADLARKVSVSTVTQDDGTLSVFIGNGQNLVLGNRANTLEAVHSTADPNKLDIRFAGNKVGINDALNGGEIGGLLDFQNKVLDPAQTKLDDLAARIATEFNDLHKQGKDLDGNPGGNFFSAATGAKDFKVGISDPRKFAAALDDGTGQPAPGDNRNALKLAGLQSPQDASVSGYQEEYGRMVSEVGVWGNATSSTLEAQTALLEHATQARDSLSGVNLDEEAANLMRYQQAYEAAAKVIQIGDSIIQTLLDAVRR